MERYGDGIADPTVDGRDMDDDPQRGRRLLEGGHACRRRPAAPGSHLR
jgi:hypothetical protein